jgi:hypothetical protein
MQNSVTQNPTAKFLIPLNNNRAVSPGRTRARAVAVGTVAAAPAETPLLRYVATISGTPKTPRTCRESLDNIYWKGGKSNGDTTPLAL